MKHPAYSSNSVVAGPVVEAALEHVERLGLAVVVVEGSGDAGWLGD